MIDNTLYGNPMPEKIIRKADQRFNRFAKKFHFDSSYAPHLAAYPEGGGAEDFGILTVHNTADGKEGGIPLDPENGIMLGTIRMGFGHCRMAIALASAAHSMGYTPYWLDLMSFPESAASKTIKYLEDLYNLGSRISQRSRLFDALVWDYVTSRAAKKITFSIEEAALSRIFTPCRSSQRIPGPVMPRSRRE
jgi:hypothetical protein